MKVAIYCRLSEEDRHKQAENMDSESIQNQKSLLIQYAMDKKWDVYNIYSDDDFTGADRNRPAFKRLLRDAENHCFDIVLCKTQSRFTRELEMVEKYIHGTFPVWGIRFVSVVDNADTQVKGNKKSRQINGLINEWYLEDMSENIKSVLTNKRQNGLHIGSFALYGYLKDPEQKGHLVIDEEAAAVVREIFSLFSQGYGKTAIARLLNDRGVPNPTEYKRQKGLRYLQPKTKNSTLWKYFAISNMLVNEIYIGNMVQGKYGSVSYKTKENRPISSPHWIRVENTHAAIIDQELWDRVQKLVKQKAKPFAKGSIGLFAKKARCLHCDYTMRSSKNQAKYYLKCSTKHMAKDACQGSFISVAKLEQAVISELHRLMDEYIDKAELTKKVDFQDNLKERTAKLQDEMAAYAKKNLEYSQAIKELYLDKAKGIISESDFLEFSKDFSSEKKRLSQGIVELREQIELNQGRILTEANRRQVIEEYTSFASLNREMIEKLIDYISVGKRDQETKQIPIEIHWNF